MKYECIFSTKSYDTLIHHMGVAKIADKYELTHLSALAFERFCKDATHGWDIVGFANVVAEAFANPGFNHFRHFIIQATMQNLEIMTANRKKIRSVLEHDRVSAQVFG